LERFPAGKINAVRGKADLSDGVQASDGLHEGIAGVDAHEGSLPLIGDLGFIWPLLAWECAGALGAVFSSDSTVGVKSTASKTLSPAKEPG
jgi:hypothetical protein